MQLVANPLILAESQRPFVEFIPTPQDVVVEMLKAAQVTKEDIVYDLGCGDGRFVITAAKMFGARGVGIDIDSTLISKCRVNAEKAGVAERVNFLTQDLYETDISEATVVTIYLLPELNLLLRPKLLKELKPNTRVVSHAFDMGDWLPDRQGVVKNARFYMAPDFFFEQDATFYLWVIPAKAAGTWCWEVPSIISKEPYRLHLTQKYQILKGYLTMQNRRLPIKDIKLSGNHLHFTSPAYLKGRKVTVDYRGTIEGNVINGMIEVKEGPLSKTYPWRAFRIRENP